jgi:hypothetical protein
MGASVPRILSALNIDMNVILIFLVDRQYLSFAALSSETRINCSSTSMFQLQFAFWCREHEHIGPSSFYFYLITNV